MMNLADVKLLRSSELLLTLRKDFDRKRGKVIKPFSIASMLEIDCHRPPLNLKAGLRPERGGGGERYLNRAS